MRSVARTALTWSSPRRPRLVGDRCWRQPCSAAQEGSDRPDARQGQRARGPVPDRRRDAADRRRRRAPHPTTRPSCAAIRSTSGLRLEPPAPAVDRARAELDASIEQIRRRSRTGRGRCSRRSDRARSASTSRPPAADPSPGRGSRSRRPALGRVPSPRRGRRLAGLIRSGRASGWRRSTIRAAATVYVIDLFAVPIAVLSARGPAATDPHQPLRAWRCSAPAASTCAGRIAPCRWCVWRAARERGGLRLAEVAGRVPGRPRAAQG